MTLAIVMALAPLAANAATQGTPSLTYCDDGHHIGDGADVLTNGVLEFGWCAISSETTRTTVTAVYTKQAGSNITGELGFQWVGSDGSPQSGFRWDSSFTAQAGQRWYKRWTDNVGRPPSSTPCLRGALKVGSTVYTTRVSCP